MVGSCDVKFPIQLESLCLTHTQFSTYEPELFPGLVYRMVKPRVVLLIFVSGKVILIIFVLSILDCHHRCQGSPGDRGLVQPDIFYYQGLSKMSRSYFFIYSMRI